jgi:hypothetical protein
LILTTLIVSAALAGGEDTKPRRWVKLGPVAAEDPLRIGTQRQLLVDNEVLCDWYQVRRVMGPVKKHPENPVLQADQPWEKNAAETRGVQPTAAIYDPREKVYKLWYTILQLANKEGSGTGYATSRDGIRWTKPNLGLIEFGGQKQNNLCRLEPFGALVRGLYFIQDPREDTAERRFKAIGTWPLHEDGSWYACWLGIAYSPDGKTWHQSEGGVREGSGGGRPACIWDERLQRYLLFHRELTESALPERRKRYIVRQESADLEDWTPRRTVFNPMDPAWPEVESMNVFLHEGIFFGLAYMLELQKRGEMEIHLVTSRDGYRWDVVSPGSAFIPRGPRGDFDDMLTYSCYPVIQGDQMHFYYAGARYSHSPGTEPIVDDGGSVGYLPGSKGRVVWRPNRVGLATLPLDRFAGLRADEPVGAFLTRPILIEGDELYLNAEVDRELRVEVVNPVSQVVDAGPKDDWTGHYIAGREEVFPGFGRQDCEAVTGDSLRHRVHWKGGSIGQFKGKAVRLRILSRMATVYAFQVK